MELQHRVAFSAAEGAQKSRVLSAWKDPRFTQEGSKAMKMLYQDLSPSLRTDRDTFYIEKTDMNPLSKVRITNLKC